MQRRGPIRGERGSRRDSLVRSLDWRFCTGSIYINRRPKWDRQVLTTRRRRLICVARSISRKTVNYGRFSCSATLFSHLQRCGS